MIQKFGKAAIIIGITLGILLVVLGGASFYVIDKIIHDEVIKNIVLYKNDTTGYENWINLSGDLHIDFYFFHLNNSDEVMAGGKPMLVEKGPYSYHFLKQKANVSVDHDNGTIKYHGLSTYIFDPENSKGDPNDIITTLNVPLMGVADQLKYERPVIQKLVLGLIGHLIEKESIFYEIAVKDILWGYEDGLLKIVHDFNKSLVPDPHFGFMYNRNNTLGHLFEVYSGEKDPMQTACVKAFEGLDHLTWWQTKQANQINGSDGTYNHPFWSKNRDEYVFSSDACRSILMRFEQHTKISGIPTLKFSVPPFALESGKTYEPNAGFCIPDKEHCLPDGLLNISRCQRGAPAVMSLPHFLFVDKDVKAEVHGLNPDPEKHNAYINAEPYTGASLKGALRMQFNIWMEKFPAVDQMAKLRSLPFPVMWVNQHGMISDDAARTLKSKLITPITIANIAKWCVIGLGSVILIIALLSVAPLTVCAKWKLCKYSDLNKAESINSNSNTTEETKPLLS